MRSLDKFAKEACANWTEIPQEECVLFCGKCRILQGKLCEYFKKSVLGPEDYKYPHRLFIADPNFEKRVRKQYKKIDHTVVESEQIKRYCPDCGSLLTPRRRYCTACQKKRKLATNRLRQQQFRKKGRLTVTD